MFLTGGDIDIKVINLNKRNKLKGREKVFGFNFYDEKGGD